MHDRKANRIWLWVDVNKIPIYPIFSPLKGEVEAQALKSSGTGSSCEEVRPGTGLHPCPP